MAKTLKTWTALGVAILAGAGTAQAGMMSLQSTARSPSLILVDGEGGEGGEGGGTTITTYALGATDEGKFKYDATAQVEAYANLAFKSYEKAAEDAKLLQASLDAFLAAPSEKTLTATRKAWVAARPAYLRTETFRFYDGPIEAVEGEINAWPMNEAYVDYVEGKPDAGIINGKSPVVLADISALNQKGDEADVTTGWHAIEFLLWGQDLSATGPGNRPFTDYVAGQGNNDRRRAYLGAVADKLVGDLKSLVAAWAPADGKNYRAGFVALDQREALGRVVNGMAILAGFEFMSERLGVALDSGDQEDEHSCFSDTTKQDFVHDLEGIRRVWYEAKLMDLVAGRDTVLAKRVSGLLLEAEVKINKLADPWDQVLASPKDSPERQNAEAVVTALQALAKGLTDVGSNLGVLVLIPTG